MVETVQSARFENWVIVSDGRAQYIGRVDENLGDEMLLAPAYEWVCPTSIDPRQGIVQRGRLALPLETFACLTRLRIRPVTIVPLDGLDEDSADELERVLQRCDRPMSAASRILVPSPIVRQ